MKINISDQAKSGSKRNRFSKVSFGSAILALFLTITLTTFLPSLGKVKANEFAFKSPTAILPVLLHVFTLIGAISAILSLKLKEPNTWYKLVGFTLSLILFLLIYGTMLFAILIDMSR